MDCFFRYIPVRPRDVQWGLYVTGAGSTAIAPGSGYPPSGHPQLYDFTWEKGRTLPEYQAVYISRGEGEFESAATGYKSVRAGMLLLLFPGVWHRYRPLESTGWDELWVSFHGSSMDRLVDQRFFTPEHAVLTLQSDAILLGAYERLLDRVRNPVEGFPHLIAADTLEVLAAALAGALPETADLVTQGPRNVVTLKDRVVAEAVRMIWDRSRRSLSVDDVVRQFPVARRSLERRFRTELGHTVLQEIVRCRLDRATRLLASTNRSLKEVAMAAGFPSAKAMHDAFLRQLKTTPLAFRRDAGQGHAAVAVGRGVAKSAKIVAKAR